MAKVFLGMSLIAITLVLAGCLEVNKGEGQIIAPRTKYAPEPVQVPVVSGAVEADIVEQVATYRQAYRQGLQSLIDYYTQTGNNMKMEWAQKELAQLDLMPQYRYIIQAEVAGPELKAIKPIPAANALYDEAVSYYKAARLIPILVNDDKMRIALDKFNQVIQKYPSSDKIDDAAFMAGEIYYHFKDYSIALLYFQRTYQWDTETPHPARYKAASILDRRLKQRDEALRLYRESIEKEPKYRNIAEKRVAELAGEQTKEK
ncbi:MAG: tetratricopeptide repeat protein [Planctomycetota bacterium]